MKVKIDPGAYVPTRAHEDDAGLDLYSMEEKTIYPRWSIVVNDDGTVETKPIAETFNTGVHMAIPRGYYGKIESRSGLNINKNVVSCGGTIDAGYRGSIAVELYNLGAEPHTVRKGDRIAQIVIMPCSLEGVELVEHLDDTPRGSNGFGSTGV